MLFRILSILKREGFKGLNRRVKNRFHMKKQIALQESSINEFYDFIENSENSKEEKFTLNTTNTIINWILPHFGAGSGGHINIIRFINFLEKEGFSNRVYIYSSLAGETSESLKEFAEDFYNLNKNSNTEFYPNLEYMDYSHFAIASAWQSAYYVKKFAKTLHKLYFVQDFEPDFSPKSSEYFFAENTYKFGFFGITAGNWLSKKLKADYGMSCESFSFSYDKNLYKPSKKIEDDTIRIGLYVRFFTPRRLFEMYVLALNLLYKKCQEEKIKIEISFVGQDVSQYSFPFPIKNIGSCKLELLPKIYSNNDIFLVPSGTNLSLLPLEIMACKSLVVSNRGENVEWLLNEENSLLTDLDPVDIAKKVFDIIKDSKKREVLTEKGLLFAQSTSWENEGKVVSNILKRILERGE